MAAKIPVTPNLNFPAKNFVTNTGMAWRGQVPIFGRIGRQAAGWQPKFQLRQI